MSSKYELCRSHSAHTAAKLTQNTALNKSSDMVDPQAVQGLAVALHAELYTQAYRDHL